MKISTQVSMSAEVSILRVSSCVSHTHILALAFQELHSGMSKESTYFMRNMQVEGREKEDFSTFRGC